MQTTGGKPEPIQPLFSGEDVLKFHQTVRQVPIAEEVAMRAVQLAAMSRPKREGTPASSTNG